MDASADEREIQSLMEIFDYGVDRGNYEICESDNSDVDCSEESNELVDELMLVTGGEKFDQLFEAFTTTRSWLEKDKDILASLLSSLKNLWIHPQWEACLQHLCCNSEFRRVMLKIVEFFELELKKCQVETTILHETGQISYSTLISLVPSIIPPLLKLLRFVHALWRDNAVFRFPKKLIEAKDMSSSGQTCDSLGETSKINDTVGEDNKLGNWLQLIRENGYSLLGLCAPIKGAFYDLLDRSSIHDAIMENLRSMEFRHVTKLIDFVIIPFVKYCPRELWEEWMLQLLLPLFSYCEDMLFYSWFNLRNSDRANGSYYFGYICGSEETVKKRENYLLLDFTRKVSKFLGALASPELNQGLSSLDLNSVPHMFTTSHDSQCGSSNSVVGYVLLNDCLERLSMNLFGWWVDDEATIDAIPFCHALVQVVVATNNEKLRRFVEGDMLPAVIRRLCDDVPCAIQRTIAEFSNQMNSSKSKMASNDLLVLCQKIYKLCVQSQDLEGEDQGNSNIASRFEDWFAEQKEDLYVKASCDTPEDFPAKLWNWEFEEEFQKYLPIYIDLLHEVDALYDCLEYDSSDYATLFGKLSLEFRTRHAINSCKDRHVLMISDLLERKMPVAYYERRSDQMVKWLCKLITLKPYIKVSDSWTSVMGSLRENFVIGLHFEWAPEDAVNILFKSIFYFWEPQFHPLIREGQEDMLVRIAGQLVLAEVSKCYKPLDLDPEDFMDHLKPYAHSYIYRKRKESEYFTAREQVKLHEEFDKYLASGELDDVIYDFGSLQDEFVKDLAEKHIAKSQFAGLDLSLVKFSLEQRAQIVKRQRQIFSYSECLRNSFKNEELKDHLNELMVELEVEGFFDVNNNSTDWKKKIFLQLIGNFEELVFGGYSFPRCLVVQGIMDYWEISQRSGITWEDSFEEVVDVVSHRWRKDLAQLWMDTRYYEGLYYDLLRQPLKKIFPRKVEAPKDLQAIH